MVWREWHGGRIVPHPGEADEIPMTGTAPLLIDRYENTSSSGLWVVLWKVPDASVGVRGMPGLPLRNSPWDPGTAVCFSSWHLRILDSRFGWTHCSSWLAVCCGMWVAKIKQKILILLIDAIVRYWFDAIFYLFYICHASDFIAFASRNATRSPQCWDCLTPSLRSSVSPAPEVRSMVAMKSFL